MSAFGRYQPVALGRNRPEAVSREHLLRLKWVSTSVPLDASISGGINQELIRNVRKQLHLSQREAAEPFGGGPNAFSRYERGSTEAPQPLVQGCTSLLCELNCTGFWSSVWGAGCELCWASDLLFLVFSAAVYLVCLACIVVPPRR